MKYHTPEFNLTKPHFSFNDIDKLPDDHKIHIFEDTFISLVKINKNYWRKETHTHTYTYIYICSFTFMSIAFTK